MTGRFRVMCQTYQAENGGMLLRLVDQLCQVTGALEKFPEKDAFLEKVFQKNRNKFTAAV